MTNAVPLRFLADECCDFAAVRALRSAGYDVFAVAETTQSSVDRLLMQQAEEEQRVLLTEDKDFGWLTHVNKESSAGVILIRYPAHARQQLGPSIVALVEEHGSALLGAFVVMQPGQIRLNRRSP